MSDEIQDLKIALAESEERFQQLSSGMFEAVAIHDEGVIVEVNDTFADLFGYNREEILGRHAFDLVAPDWRDFIAGRLAEPSEVPYEAQGIRQNGEIFWGELRARPVHFGGRPMRMVIIQDITQRRAAEFSQRRRLAQVSVHRAVLEMVNVGDFEKVVLVVADALKDLGVEFEAVGLNMIDEQAGTVTAYAVVAGRLAVQEFVQLDHPEIQALLKYWRRREVYERVPGKSLHELIGQYPDGDRPYDPTVIIDVPFEQGTLVVGLNTAVGENDQLIELLQRFCPLLAVGYARTRDLAEREQAEGALRLAHDELERRVQERTAELSTAIQAMRREVSVRRRAESELTDSLQQKEVLLQEVHHRVKNNLQVIASMLSLQSSYEADEAVLRHIDDMRNRVMSMALIHEGLYKSPNLERIDLREYVETLARQLFQSHGVNEERICLRMDLQSTELNIEVAIPCGLVLNEIISNALQHAFPAGRSGCVGVELAADGAEGFVLTIWDDGIGLAAGIDVGRSDSLGLILVQALTSQLGASCDVDRTAGTRYTIRVPMASRSQAQQSSPEVAPGDG